MLVEKPPLLRILCQGSVLDMETDHLNTSGKGVFVGVALDNSPAFPANAQVFWDTATSNSIKLGAEVHGYGFIVLTCDKCNEIMFGTENSTFKCMCGSKQAEEPAPEEPKVEEAVHGDGSRWDDI
jgi:hypothetical protein